ncbi:S8 family peptidase [Kitasatospora purpeofusca]|uniref:S8 family peptidase n=1 Tax=Kitasatospora purpeofusca TaxID=67352 RepID=UPI0036C90D10
MSVQNGAPWGLARISHRRRLGLGTFTKYVHDEKAGEGVDVYVLDSGISTDHQEFEGRARWGTNVVDGEDDSDANGQGTHLAGIVAGRKYGVAKKATVIAVKVANASGTVEPKALVKGLEWTAEQAKASGRPSVALIGAALDKNADLDAAVNTAANQGLFVVVAAGDFAKDALDYSPAGATGAFTVAASTLGDERTYFSNHGPAVEVFAPGLNIASAYTGSVTEFCSLSGTAQAAAHVAGLGAYLLSTSGDVTPATVRDAITVLATPDCLVDVPPSTSNLLAFNNAPDS